MNTHPRLITQFACCILVAAGITTAASAAAAAEDNSRCPFSATLDRNDITYYEKTSNMLARGALNAGLGWTEAIVVPAKEAQDGGNVFFGVAKGFGLSFMRTAEGVGELLTFWAPKVNGEYIQFSKDSPLDMHIADTPSEATNRPQQ